MKNTTNIQDLASRINKHDIFACYSDSDSVYQKEQKAKKEINKELSTLTLEQKHELASLITDDRFLQYFKLDNLPALPKVESFRSKVFRAAWYFFNKGIYETFKESLIAAWKRNRIIKALKTGTIALKFRKTTGEIRTANATLQLATEYKSKTESKYTPDVIKFLTADGWRSCRIERIIAA